MDVAYPWPSPATPKEILVVPALPIARARAPPHTVPNLLSLSLHGWICQRCMFQP